MPWKTVNDLCTTIEQRIATLGDDYMIKDNVAIHKTAVIGHNVTIKAPAIISDNCFVGSNSYLRNGVFLAPGSKVGISCEVKTSIMLEDSAIAHFNFVGDSIIGHNVNVEAGAILCNHYKKGVETEGIRIAPFTGCKCVFFADPDGLPIELVEMK